MVTFTNQDTPVDDRPANRGYDTHDNAEMPSLGAGTTSESKNQVILLPRSSECEPHDDESCGILPQEEEALEHIVEASDNRTIDANFVATSVEVKIKNIQAPVVEVEGSMMKE